MIDTDQLLIAHYVGDHKGDKLSVRAGWAATRLVQEGRYKAVTHCENIVGLYAGRAEVDIGSASIRDGGKVRIKKATILTPGNWVISLHPSWSRARSRDWFERAEAGGMLYDYWGAWATVMPGHADPKRAFCNEASALSVGFVSADIFGPAQWAAICMSHPAGVDYTREFYAERGIDLIAVAPNSAAALLAKAA